MAQLSFTEDLETKTIPSPFSNALLRDLGFSLSTKPVLAAEIIKALDREGLSVRGAQGRTGIAAADFSGIRNADLGRFTADRPHVEINRLGSQVELKIKGATRRNGRTRIVVSKREGW